MPNENPIPLQLPGTSLHQTHELGSSSIIISGCQKSPDVEPVQNAVNFPDISLLDEIASEPCAEWLADKTWNDAAPK